MKNRRCKVCKQSKPTEEYGKQIIKGKIYIRHICKKCIYLRHIDYMKVYTMNLRKTEKYKIYHKKKIKEHIKKYPEKQKARVAVRTALNSGIIEKNPCIICGKVAVQAHHSDYSKPLQVEWYCIQHHNNVHHPRML